MATKEAAERAMTRFTNYAEKRAGEANAAARISSLLMEMRREYAEICRQLRYTSPSFMDDPKLDDVTNEFYAFLKNFTTFLTNELCDVPE